MRLLLLCVSLFAACQADKPHDSAGRLVDPVNPAPLLDIDVRFDTPQVVPSPTPVVPGAPGCTRATADVLEVLRADIAHPTSCIRETISRAEQLQPTQPTLHVSFAITPGGFVNNFQVLSPEPRDPMLSACLKAAFGRTSFPSAAGGSCSVILPITARISVIPR